MARASESTAESPCLEVIEQSEPIRAWRGLAIALEGNNVVLNAINSTNGNFLAVEHKAVCRASENGMFGYVPFTFTMPGLTMLGSPPPIKPVSGKHDAPHESCGCGFYGVKDKSNAQGRIIAEVDLYGKVIEHELGYRAEYQRVLSVRVIRPVHCGDAFLCDGRPELLWFSKKGGIQGICAECASQKKRVATLSKLAARLGVEVRWDD